MKKLILVRHGETDFNRQHRIQGQTDTVLNRCGERQARNLSAILENEQIHEIWSSPLHRAIQTAEVINQHHELTVHRETLLKERSFGILEGETHQTFLKQEKINKAAIDWIPPKGESLRQIYKRAEYLSKKIQQSSTRTLLLVGHAGINRALIGALMEWDVDRWRAIPQENTCLNTFLINDNNQVAAFQLNDTTHNEFI